MVQLRLSTLSLFCDMLSFAFVSAYIHLLISMACTVFVCVRVHVEAPGASAGRQ